MMHACNRAVRDARQRMRPLLDDLEREGSGGQDDMGMFMQYITETGPDDTPEEIGPRRGASAPQRPLSGPAGLPNRA